MICCGILKLLTSLCMTYNKETINFLIKENGISILKYLFETVGKFTIDFVKSLSQFLNLPISSESQTDKLMALLIENIALNIRIWYNSDHQVQLMLIGSIRDLLLHSDHIEFSSGEPYNGLLLMLFDYFAPEDDNSLNQFLSEIRLRLRRTFVDYFDIRGKEDAIPAIINFLLPIPVNLYSIRDLLYSLLCCQSKRNIIENHCMGKTKKKEFNLIIALHSLIDMSINQKVILDKVITTDNIQITNSKRACFEDIIAYSIYILLSLPWEEIFRKENQENTIQTLKKLPELNTFFEETECFMNYLQTTKGKFTMSEEIILLYLFYNPKLNSVEYNEHYLGSKVYTALMSHITSIPFVNYLKIERLQVSRIEQHIWKMDKSILFYTKLIENLRSFEPIIQQRILTECEVLLTITKFAEVFFKLTNMYEAICAYLKGKDYLLSECVKEGLEHLYYKFLNKAIQDNRIQFLLCDLLNFPEAELLKIVNTFLNLTLQSLPNFTKNESIYTAIHLACFLEDAVILYPSILSKGVFVEVLARFIIYLNEVGMLYYWEPLTLKGSLNPAEVTQKEVGILRIILKLLFSVISNEQLLDEMHKKLIFKAMGFYVFRKEKTLISIMKLLNLHIVVANKDPVSSSKTILLNTTIKENVPSPADLLIQQKKSKNIRNFHYELLDLDYYRITILLTYISQVILYKVYGEKSYKNLKIQTISSDYAFTYLVKTLGRLLNTCSDNGLVKFLKSTENSFPKSSIHPIKKCFSNIDGYSKKEIESARPVEDPLQSKSTVKIFPVDLQDYEKFIKEVARLTGEILQLFTQYEKKEVREDLFVMKIVQMISSEEVLETIQPNLHRIASEDFLLIERDVLKYVENRVKMVSKRLVIYEQSENDAKQIIRMHNYIQAFIKAVHGLNIGLTSDPENSLNKKNYNDLCNKALSNFHIQNKENAKVYAITSKYYEKLLRRCELNQSLKVSNNPLAFKSFIKLDLARDNLNRAMRFKEIKHPLTNPSVLKGISYVRQYFLKRVLIQGVNEKLLMEFLFPEKYQNKLLKALMIHCRSIEKSIVGNRIAKNGLMDKKEAKENVFVIRSCVSRTQLASECNVKSEIGTEFKADIVKIDHSIFGVVKFLKNELVFSSKIKKDLPKYRTGPPMQMQLLSKKVKKSWYYRNIKKVIERKYSLLKQAVEIRFKDNKAVFLVLFGESEMNAFLDRLTQVGVKIITNCKKDFVSKKFTEKWLNMDIGNFEYLMTVNDYANRSFQCMSQYPVFPWLLIDFSNKDLRLSGTKIRELEDSIAGISAKKREQADKKYENTGDFPGGRFQFGTHYLPGRGVLGYLMRIQPYTYMIYRFDSGGDCPSRCFHKLENIWCSTEINSDNNLELIPEFYYFPEFLANQYWLNLSVVIIIRLG